MSIGERTDSLLLSAALSASTRNFLGPHILDVYGKDEPCTLELQAKLTALSQQITKRSVNENYPSFCFLLIAVLTLSPAWAAQPKYKTFYVFGDSLSDTGNDLILTKQQKINPRIPPSGRPHQTYFKGRFSNGPVAAEYLWDLLEKKQKHLIPFLSVKDIASSEAISFAFGGSKSGYLNQMPGDIYVPGTLGQVDLFRKALKGKKLKADSLFVIWQFPHS